MGGVIMKRVCNGQKISKKVRKFISHVENHISQWGVSLVWGRGSNIQCFGYTAAACFCEDDKVIKVASKNSFWLDNLVHEYAHFLQWIEGNKLFKLSGDAIIDIDNWFNKEEISKSKLSRSFYILRSMERDCEMKASKIAKKFKLPIRTQAYARRANFYIYTHWIMEKERKFWAYSRDPMESKYIMSLMPNNFRKQTHKSIPPKILKALTYYI